MDQLDGVACFRRAEGESDVAVGVVEELHGN